jgi:hypothetical protein
MKAGRFAPGSVLFMALFATASMAQNSRTFVSGAGSDTNPCSLTSPCRTFTQAISMTNAGGEVVVLSSAGYGPFTIKQAVTIEAPPGLYAGVTATLGDAIDINAGPSDTVILRGLTVNNQGGSGNGIDWLSGGTLHIESCVVNGFANGGGSGIEIDGSGSIFVTDTVARNNGDGVFVEITSGAATVAMDHLHLDGNLGNGLTVGTNGSGAVVNAAIRNSSASGNRGNGMEAFAEDGTVLLSVESCLIADNGNIGVSAGDSIGGSGAASISNCTITGSSSGFNVGMGAAIYSRGNNTITGNGPNTGTLTALTAM